MFEKTFNRVDFEKVKNEEGVDKLSECVTIITEQTGKRFVLINDLRFKGKTKEEWKEIEVYLKEYIGKYYEISETAENKYDLSES